MKQNWIHKTIALFFGVLIALPFLVQGIHAIEQHEHTVCIAEFEQHFHADDLDCSICHFQIKHNYFDFSLDYAIEKADSFKQKFENTKESNYVVQLISKPSRGPPYFII